MKTAIRTATVLAATLAAAGLASAATVKGNYDADYSKDVTITSPVRNGSVNTNQFEWSRTDIAPPAPGADLTISSNFITYCVELSQSIGSSSDKTFNVVTPAAHGFSPTQTSLILNLWGTYLPTVNSSNESAAFQAAIWEIVYDTDLSLTSGSFKLNTSGTIRNTAQAWLDGISAPSYSYTGPNLALAVLESASVQDQITVMQVVPTPASAAMGLAGCVFLMARRRPRA